MIHQFRDKKRIEASKNIKRNTIISVVIILLSITGVLAWSGKLFSIIGRPIWKAQNNLINTASDARYIIRTKSSVFAENEKLKIANADLQASMTDYQILKTENTELKELMGRLSTPGSFILGTILVKPNRSPYDTIIIDVGTDSGVVEGERVYANASVPIGEISKVYDHDSLVMLYSNPGSNTDANLEGSNTTVTLVGRGGGNFEMTVPADLIADKGAMVVFPNTTLPEIVAIVDGLISVPTDPSHKFILHSPINIQSLKWVEVKKK